MSQIKTIDTSKRAKDQLPAVNGIYSDCGRCLLSASAYRRGVSAHATARAVLARVFGHRSIPRCTSAHAVTVGMSGHLPIDRRASPASLPGTDQQRASND